MEIRWPNPREFNLIPPDILKREEFRRIKSSLLICGATIILLFAMVWWRFPSADELLHKTGKPTPPTMHLSQTQWALMDKRHSLADLLSRVADSTGEKIWLSSMRYDDETRSMTLFGQGYSADTITAFVNMLKDTGHFKNGKILSLTQDQTLIRFKWEGTFK